MQLEEHAVDDVIVLAPSGRMARNESFGAVRLRLHHLAQEGRRKLVMGEAAKIPGYVVVLNWFEELKRLVPTDE